MIDKRSPDFQRPWSLAAEERTDNLIKAIATLRFESYHAHASERPALCKTLWLLSFKLGTALANENPHVTKPVVYEDRAGDQGSIRATTPEEQKLIDDALAPLMQKES